MLTWCINDIVFVQVAADCYYWFPMPYGLLKPCVLFFLRKIASNYSIVTHQKSCISLYRGVKPFTYSQPAVIDYSQDLFYFWCVSVPISRMWHAHFFRALPSWYTVRYMMWHFVWKEQFSLFRACDMLIFFPLPSWYTVRYMMWHFVWKEQFSLFRACDMLIFFRRCLHGILCGIWYDISCERNSSVSRVTSLDLVKSVSTASKGLLRWLGWSIPFWEPCSWINS